MKKFFCIALLILSFAPECAAMNRIKNIAVLSGGFFVNGGASMATGARDGGNGGFMKGEALFPRTVSFGSSLAFLLISPSSFIVNSMTQGAIYKFAYKKGKSFTHIED